MAIPKNKKRVVITIDKQLLHLLKVKAAQADMTLSKYLLREYI